MEGPLQLHGAEIWPGRTASDGLDVVFNLPWEGFRAEKDRGPEQALAKLVGEGLDLSNGSLQSVSFSTEGRRVSLPINAAGSELIEVDFSGVDLSGASLSGAALDGCVFRGADAKDAAFVNVLMLDCDITNMDVSRADFRGLDNDSSAIIHHDDITMGASRGNERLAKSTIDGLI